MRSRTSPLPPGEGQGRGFGGLVLSTFAALCGASFAYAAEPAASSWPEHLPLLATQAGDFVPEGIRQESVLSTDLNGDGREDQAMVLRDADFERRVLLVALGGKDGFHRIGIGELDTGALGDASLSAPKGVLVVEDLTGGTTATASTYRYRYERETGRMRLIGDDVSLYSRTMQHGMTTVSTNRLTGKRITTINDLVGEGEDASLGPDKATTTKVPVEPRLYLETAPLPDSTLGLDR
jgi:hypothetical protein